MLDWNIIRQDPVAVGAALAKRGEAVDFEKLLDLDRTRRELVARNGDLRASRNRLAREVGARRSRGDDSSDLQQEAGRIKQEIASVEGELADVEASLNQVYEALPNTPHESVRAGGKEYNEVLRTWGEPPQLAPGYQDHVELSTRLGLVDYERGTKLGGSGYWLYTGMGAALEWALLDFFCREHFRDGYTFMLPPHLLIPECGFAAGQFPKFKADVFEVGGAGAEAQHFLLPTSETAILNVYRDEVISFDSLPIKAFAYSPCYRREGGGYRSDERGTVRGHQFNKVEMFQFTHPERWREAFDELVARSERLLQALGLHYRTSKLAAGDTSAAMAMTYDIEVWIPSLQAYKEVSSVSWSRDYQARRAGIRFRDPTTGKLSFVHTLNGSGLATSRLLPALLEQCQLGTGEVVVPEPLRPWVGKEKLGP